MKNLFLLLAILSIQLSYSQMIAPDKQMHFAGGAFVGGMSNLVMYSESYKPIKALWCGIIAGTLAGIAKEALDESNYKGWDNKDLAFTIAGTITATVPLYFWEKGHKKRRDKRLEALKIK